LYDKNYQGPDFQNILKDYQQIPKMSSILSRPETLAAQVNSTLLQ